MSNKPQKQATVNAFWIILSPQYLPELLVDVYSYCLMVKIVSSCCVNGTSFSQVQPQMYLLNVYISKSRQAVVGCEAKKQHVQVSSGLRDHYSELSTWMAGLKF